MKNNDEKKAKDAGTGCFILIIIIVLIWLFSKIGDCSGPSNNSTSTEDNSTKFSNKYVVNADVIFAATSEANYSTMMNCVTSGDKQAIEKMVLYGQVKYLYRNDVVYLVSAKWKYFIIRPEGSTEMLYVVGEQLTQN